MKNQIKNVILFVAIFATILFTGYKAFRYGAILFGGTDLETRKFNMALYKSGMPNPADELVYALQWYCNWDNVFMTDHFKEKYKNRRQIIPNINKYSRISGGWDHELESNNIAYIHALNKRNIIQIITGDRKTITDEYYFECFVDENGYLDDIKLLKHQVVDSATRESIE